MRVELDQDTCMGHGRCYSLSPELFECDELGYGVVVVTHVTDQAEIAAAERAARSCPEEAIRLLEE